MKKFGKPGTVMPSQACAPCDHASSRLAPPRPRIVIGARNSLAAKPVPSTKHTAPPSGGAGRPRCSALSPAVCCISVVPLYSTCTRCTPIRSSGALPAAALSACAASFICGTLSPVRFASFTTAPPASSRQSTGTTPSSSGLLLFTRLITSPGSRSSLATSAQTPPRSACTMRDRWPMPRSVCRLRRRVNAVVPSNIKIIAMLNSAYFQYSSMIHSPALNSWNCVTGPSSCSLYSSKKRGIGIVKSLRPKRSRSVPGLSAASAGERPLEAR